MALGHDIRHAPSKATCIFLHPQPRSIPTTCAPAVSSSAWTATNVAAAHSAPTCVTKSGANNTSQPACRLHWDRSHCRGFGHC